MLSVPHLLLALMLLQIYATADERRPSLDQPSNGRYRPDMSCDLQCLICRRMAPGMPWSLCEIECEAGAGDTYDDCIFILDY